MKISVVTISFNQAKFLSDCIQSVAQQEGPWEHIIVDPGSTDGSRELIDRHIDHFSHIVYEKDQGPADGLNRGFARATGEIFYYLNSDDILLPDAFREIRSLFEANPQSDVIAGGGYILDADGGIRRRVWSDNVSRLGLAYGGSILIQPSSFFRREAFQKTAGFNVSNRCDWDGELVVDLFESGAQFKRVDHIWSGFRLHGESITGSDQLSDEIVASGRKRFTRLLGRNPKWFDKWIVQGFRIMRILKRPVILIERLNGGKVRGGA